MATRVVSWEGALYETSPAELKWAQGVVFGDLANRLRLDLGVSASTMVRVLGDNDMMRALPSEDPDVTPRSNR